MFARKMNEMNDYFSNHLQTYMNILCVASVTSVQDSQQQKAAGAGPDHCGDTLRDGGSFVLL